MLNHLPAKQSKGIQVAYSKNYMLDNFGCSFFCKRKESRHIAKIARTKFNLFRVPTHAEQQTLSDVKTPIFRQDHYYISQEEQFFIFSFNKSPILCSLDTSTITVMYPSQSHSQTKLFSEPPHTSILISRIPASLFLAATITMFFQRISKRNVLLERKEKKYSTFHFFQPK